MKKLSGKAGYLRYRFNHKELIPAIKIPIFELAVQDASIFLSLTDISNVTLVPSGKKKSQKKMKIGLNYL